MKMFFRKDTFKDFKGNERPFTLCGIIHNSDVDGVAFTVKDSDSPFPIPDKIWGFDGIFAVGLSICHEQDLKAENPLIGLAQAEGRATRIRNCALVMPLSNKNIFTISIAEDIMDNIVEDVKRAPGKYIPGYNQMEETYLKKKNLKSNV